MMDALSGTKTVLIGELIQVIVVKVNRVEDDRRQGIQGSLCRESDPTPYLAQ